MKRSNKIFMVFLSVFSFVIFNSHSPGEDVVGPNGCAECHSGGSADGSITITPNSGCIGLNSTIFMTLCVNDPNAIEAGFNIKASDGIMSAGIGSRTGFGGPTILTHSAPLLISNGEACWTIEWRSPTTTGLVTFEVWGNAVNDDDWFTGDAPYFVSSSLEVKTALPVALSSFDLTQNAGEVILNWETQTESTDDLFIVERSLDGAIFEAIASIDGNGITSSSNTYSFIDSTPLLEQNSYYRIQQQDIDGSFAYTDVQSIFVKSSDIQALKVYPTLVNASSEINIEFKNTTVTNNAFFIVDNLGRKISAHNFEGQAGRNEFQISTAGLNSGMYYLLAGSDKNMMEAVGFVVRD